MASAYTFHTNSIKLIEHWPNLSIPIPNEVKCRSCSFENLKVFTDSDKAELTSRLRKAIWSLFVLAADTLPLVNSSNYTLLLRLDLSEEELMLLRNSITSKLFRLSAKTKLFHHRSQGRLESKRESWSTSELNRLLYSVHRKKLMLLRSMRIMEPFPTIHSTRPLATQLTSRCSRKWMDRRRLKLLPTPMEEVLLTSLMLQASKDSKNWTTKV